MALNVNIIGKDSEGNLRALKVNSEGNLEISGFSEWGELLQDISDKLELVEAELQTIKTNQLSGNQKVQQVGTLPVIYISRLEDRPSATEVEIGQFVILTDEELPMWVSNGVNWVEVL